MPNTKIQEVVYGILMTFFMVLAMELYNAGLINHGLTNAIILHSLPDIFIIFPICFVMGFLSPLNPCVFYQGWFRGLYIF